MEIRTYSRKSYRRICQRYSEEEIQKILTDDMRIEINTMTNNRHKNRLVIKPVRIDERYKDLKKAIAYIPGCLGAEYFKL